MDKQWFKNRLRDLNKTQVQLARHAGMEPSRLSEILGSRREVKIDEAAAFAEFLDVSIDTLLNKLGSGYKPPARSVIPVVGYVGAGEMVLAFDDHALGNGIREIEAPPGAEGSFAVEVVGHSMHPRFKSGDCIVYDREAGLDVSNCYGLECVVETRDGQKLIKLVEQGSRRGTLTLVSINSAFPIMMNVPVEWVAPITWVRPSRTRVSSASQPITS